MATKTLIGLFETKERADSAVQDLMHEGFSSSDIQMQGYDEFGKAGHVERQPGESGFHAFLREIGLVGPDRKEAYQEGDYLVTVDADDAHVDHAADILNRHGAIDIDQRTAGYGKTGAAAPEKVESIEEELRLGKRQVSRGGVRIYTRPTEREVDVPISLREEEIHVERHATDRPAGEKDLGAFKEQSFEVHAEGEEPVVGKEARVKEEVELTKRATERKETIHETLRGTKVEVEQLSPDEESAFRSVESEFHDDYDRRYATSGADYDEVLPAYRYGYRVGHDPFYSGADWNDVEPKVKEDWDQHNWGGWDFYKDAVHRGWESAARH